MRRPGVEFAAAAAFLATVAGGEVKKAHAHESVRDNQHLSEPARRQSTEPTHSSSHKAAHEGARRDGHHGTHAGIDLFAVSGPKATATGIAGAVEHGIRVGQADCEIGLKVGRGVEMGNKEGDVKADVTTVEGSFVCHPDAFGSVPVSVGGQIGGDHIAPRNVHESSELQIGVGPRAEAAVGPVRLGVGVTLGGLKELGKGPKGVADAIKDVGHGKTPEVRVGLSAGIRFKGL